MATRSNIGIKLANGKVEAIYCHWNGYLSYNGKMLLKYYNTEEKIKKLIALGDISVLKEKVAPPKGKKHSYNEPIENVTVAYHRDRKEEFNMLKFDSEEKYFGPDNNSDSEYRYLFKDGKWFVSDHGKKLKKITLAMCEEKKKSKV